MAAWRQVNESIVLKLDGFHFMRRFDLGITHVSHVYYKSFMSDLMFAIFAKHEGDWRDLTEAAYLHYSEKGLSRAEAVQRITRADVQKYCRRRVPPANELYMRVREVVERYEGKSYDDVPLYNSYMPAIWQQLQVHIRRGCLSDPDPTTDNSVPLYAVVGTEFFRQDPRCPLTVYRTCRSTSQLEAYHRVLKSNFQGASCGVELGHALICDCAYRFNCSRAAHAEAEGVAVSQGLAEDPLPGVVMDPFSVAVLNKRNNDTFGSDAFPLFARDYDASESGEEVFGLAYTRARFAEVKAMGDQEDGAWEDVFSEAIQESSGRIQRIDDELADRDIDSTVASSGDLPESSLEANTVSGGSSERARKRARLAFSGSVARPRNPSISKEMSDLVLKLLAIHGSDIDGIYRAYEVEYRNRKALDSTCGLFQTSRELIRKFVVGDAKHQAAAELDVLDPAGKVRMNALKQPVVRVPDGVFESSQAAPVSYDPIFVEPASATSRHTHAAKPLAVRCRVWLHCVAMEVVLGGDRFSQPRELARLRAVSGSSGLTAEGAQKYGQ